MIKDKKYWWITLLHYRFMYLRSTFGCATSVVSWCFAVIFNLMMSSKDNIWRHENLRFPVLDPVSGTLLQKMGGAKRWTQVLTMSYVIFWRHHLIKDQSKTSADDGSCTSESTPEVYIMSNVVLYGKTMWTKFYVYISYCHNVYLSLAENRNDFHLLGLKIWLQT